MSDKTTGKTVKFTLDPDQPAPLSDVEVQEIEQLASKTDESIDYSDIKPRTEGVNWSRPEALVRTENKQQITLRLDADVVAFFRSTGRRYQSRINEVLRAYMEAHRR